MMRVTSEQHHAEREQYGRSESIRVPRFAAEAAVHLDGATTAASRVSCANADDLGERLFAIQHGLERWSVLPEWRPIPVPNRGTPQQTLQRTHTR